ncbi:MAG: preprotein translocase subunit SecE [Firmicutes bacterium]|nr:preprotein translocase subunit SecE [Bacillota bacterium]
MGNSKKKKPETGGLQEPKMTVAEREEAKVEKEKERRKDKKAREKKEKKERKGIARTLREVGGELKKVRWPSFARTVSQTGVVLGVVVVFALVVFGIDQGLSQLYTLLTRGL